MALWSVDPMDPSGDLLLPLGCWRVSCSYSLPSCWAECSGPGLGVLGHRCLSGVRVCSLRSCHVFQEREKLVRRTVWVVGLLDACLVASPGWVMVTSVLAGLCAIQAA